MRITITKEFNTAQEAMEFLARVQGPSPAPEQFKTIVVPEQLVAEGQPVAKTRKPRSDAGQARGAYKTRGNVGGSPAEALTGLGAQAPAEPIKNAKPEGAGAPAGVAAVTAPVSPASKGEKPAPAAAASAAAPTAAPSGAALTLEAVRATLKVLNDTPDKGTEACISAIQKFGVNRISDLPVTKYAEFVTYVKAQLPAPKAA